MEHEPAHPIQFDNPNTGLEYHNGLTKLEYFAGQAMQGLTSGLSVNGVQHIIIKDLCTDSITLAKELIKQLDNAE